MLRNMAQPSLKEFTIALAHPTQAEELTDISIAAKSYWQYPDEWLAQWKEDLTITAEYIKQHRVCLLQGPDRIVGFCAVEQHPTHEEVAHLWLRPAFMRRGLGKRLLHHTLSVVSPGREVRVIADPHAESFYQKQGFATYEQVASMPPGRWLPRMRKRG